MKNPKKKKKKEKASIDLLECKTVSVFVSAEGSRLSQTCRNRVLSPDFDEECVHVRKDGNAFFFFLILLQL